MFEFLSQDELITAIKNGCIQVVRHHLLALEANKWTSPYTIGAYEAFQKAATGNMRLLLAAYYPGPFPETWSEHLVISLLGKDTAINPIRKTLSREEIRLQFADPKNYGSYFDESSSFPIIAESLKKKQDADRVKQAERSRTKQKSLKTELIEGLTDERWDGFRSKEREKQLNEYCEAYVVYIDFISESFGKLISQFKLIIPSSIWSDNYKMAETRALDAIMKSFASIDIKYPEISRETFKSAQVFLDFNTAVISNNASLASYCWGILRHTDIPIDEILTIALEMGGLSVLEAIFKHDSFSVLKILCADKDALAIVQKYILDKKLILYYSKNYDRNDCRIADLCMLILETPQLGIEYIDSIEIKSLEVRRELGVDGYSGIAPDQATYLMDIKLNWFFLILIRTNAQLIKNNNKIMQAIKIYAEAFSWTTKDFIIPVLLEASPSFSNRLYKYIPPELFPLPSINELAALTAMFDRVYTIFDPTLEDYIYFRLNQHGAIAMALDEETLKQNSDENSYDSLQYSGKRMFFKKPLIGKLERKGDNPKSELEIRSDAIIKRNQSDKKPSLQVSKKARNSLTIRLPNEHKDYVPLSIEVASPNGGVSHVGFWAHLEHYGALGNSELYDDIIMAGCILGAPYYAIQLADDKVTELHRIQLTHPKEVIPPGFKAHKLERTCEQHSYDMYTIAQLRTLMPFIKQAMKKEAIVYYEVPAIPYIIYAISYYLRGVLPFPLFEEYIDTVKKHYLWMQNELAKIATDFDVKIVILTTLDDLGFLTLSAPEILIKLNMILKGINAPIYPASSESGYQKLSQALCSAMINHLATGDKPSSELYQYIQQQVQKDPTFISKGKEDIFIDFNRNDYAALYALVKLIRSRSNLERSSETLVLMPQDEVRIFKEYSAKYSDFFGGIDAMDYAPLVMPQDLNPKNTKLFYLYAGIAIVNLLIAKGLVIKQSEAVSAIARGSAYEYLKAMAAISAILETTAEEFNAIGDEIRQLNFDA